MGDRHHARVVPVSTVHEGERSVEVIHAARDGTVHGEEQQ
jgi:hypothetical protein